MAFVNRLTRSPHEQVTDEQDSATLDLPSRADQFLRFACLNYGNDQPNRWARAAQLLTADPLLAGFSIYTASAVGNVDVVETILANDREAASREGGPFMWHALLYLTYSRLDGPSLPGVARRDSVAVARLLLAYGADPNAGFLWDGLPSPFTALTGVFGHGEQGAPPHRDELALARVLLEAGAEANDSQTIYNRGAGDTPSDDTEWLELLFEFGLGRGDGGPWRKALGHAHQSTSEIIAEAVHHAAEQGLTRRMRLLLDHGANPSGRSEHPIYEGRTPYESAVLRGNNEVAEMLASAGVSTTGVTPAMQFVGTLLSGDRIAIDEAASAFPELLDSVRTAHPELVGDAVELGRADSVRALVLHGFDVNARRRATALHSAAWKGDLAIVALLLELGADPTIVDTEFNSTPRGWAEHGGQQHIVEYLDKRAY